MVYDALTSKRVYKPVYTHENALEIILNERGKHFDPVLVDAFMEIEKYIQKTDVKCVPEVISEEV